VTTMNKPNWDMTAEELAQATQEFDREHVAETFRNMTAAEEKAWRAAIGQKRRGRSVGDNGRILGVEGPS
jgi:hypothetical protein